MSTIIQVSTDREITGLKPADKRYEVSIAGAHGLSIGGVPNGERIFEFRYAATDGKRRRMQLGLYPALRLAEAKTKAIQLRSAVIDGDDPSEERTEAQASLRLKRQRTLLLEKGLFDRYVAKKLGRELFVEVTRPVI